MLRRVVLAVVLFGCSSSPPGGGGGGAGGTAGGAEQGGGPGGGGAAGGVVVARLETWCDDYAHAVCERAARCSLGWGDDCVRSVRETCDVGAAPAIAGSLAFDDRAATACLSAALQTPGCHSFSCAVFLPKARLGERCVLGGCVEGYCSDSERQAGSLACPICKPYRALGESCQPTPGDLAWCDPKTSHCDVGFRCAPRRDAGERCLRDDQCESRTCTEYRLLDGGASRCGPVPEGGACNDEQGQQCGPFAYCKGLRGAVGRIINQGTCTPRLALGASCSNEQFDDGCSDGGSCLGSVCRRTDEVPPGGLCDDWRQCQQGGCTRQSAYLLDAGANLADGVCVSGQPAGERCYAASGCAVGLYCDGAWCRVPAPSGGVCVPGEACRTGECTEQGDGGYACAELVEPGQRCEGAPCAGDDWECLPDDAGVFTCAKRPTGAVCGNTNACEGARCGADDAGAKLCAPSCF